MAQNGIMRYYVSAFIDTVQGESEFVNTFFNTFDVADTTLAGDIFAKKGQLFFNDFTSKDSVTRKMAIRYMSNVAFYKEDVQNIKNMLDTIAPKSEAAKLKTRLIQRLGYIDSADAQIVPYLEKMYTKAGDTAYLQIEILKALAAQKTGLAFKSMKPILATEIPISDEKYEMENMLYALGDSLKLAKLVLPELIELTTINEYRKPAYALISTMKDSGIITLSDYQSIHNRLIMETRIEYKRTMAELTKEEGDNYYGGGYGSYKYRGNMSGMYDYDYDGEGGYSGRGQTLFGSLLNLTLPLRTANATMKGLTDKILEITDNDMRMELLPVLLHNGVDFKDSVYERLAKTEKTTLSFYRLLAEEKKLDKFPKQYKSQKWMVEADIKSNQSRYSTIDTTAFVKIIPLTLGKDNYVMYVYKYKYEDDENWRLFTSDAMPADTSRIFDDPKKELPFYSNSTMITENNTEEKIISDRLLFIRIKYVRERNGGYFSSYYNGSRGGSSYYDFEDFEF